MTLRSRDRFFLAMLCIIARCATSLDDSCQGIAQGRPGLQENGNLPG
jgi:hypothetical protein